MTVTPENVSDLLENLRSVVRAGFASVLYLPAYEARWDDRALAQWRTQHERIATWLVGRRSAGRPVPDLPAWRGVLARLRGQPRRHCGAGARQITVSPTGEIFPCYRTAYDPRASGLALGDVWQGIGNRERVDALAALDPEDVRPEGTQCDRCDARDGCGHFCPALGQLLLGDPSAVPRAACDLTRSQVAACRRLLDAGALAGRAPRRRRLAAAALAAAVLGGGGAGCGARAVGHASDGAVHDDGAVGQCPVFSDAGPDDGSIWDAGPVDAALLDATIGPGLCAYRLDAGELEDATISPGLCPYLPDGGGMPGIC
jgi:radical SAM protein with 4Fe4S-binding SPASM domain